MRFGVISLALAGALAMAVAGGTIAGTNPDTDADGVFDVVDNCLEDANPPAVGDKQTDYDRDGFGNACDSDYNNTGTTNGTDFNFFIGCYLISPIDQAPAGINCQNMDYNDSGTVNGTDFNFFIGDFLADLASPGSGLGGSALACALKPAISPNQTGRLPCEFDPTPND